MKSTLDARIRLRCFPSSHNLTQYYFMLQELSGDKNNVQETARPHVYGHRTN